MMTALTLFTALFMAANPCELNEDSLDYDQLAYVVIAPFEINGPSLDKWDVVFVGDGFSDSEVDENLFAKKVEEAIDVLTDTRPYRRCAFNFYWVRLVSAESGADHPLEDPPVCRNTLLNTEFGDVDEHPDDDRFVYTPTPFRCLDAADLVTYDYDIVVVLVNDTEYGGGAWPEESIPLTTVSIGDGFDHVLPHEVAHRMAPLHEEYGDWPGCYELNEYTELEVDNPADFDNITTETEYGSIPWKDLIDLETPRPTTVEALEDQNPDITELEIDNVVGLWEGGMGYDHCIYRPQRNCLMRQEHYPFCEVCKISLRKAMAFLCPQDPLIGAPWDEIGRYFCRVGTIIRIPLPYCLSCPPPLGDRPTGPGGTLTVRIDLDPRPHVRVIRIVNALGETIVSGGTITDDTLSIVFEAVPFGRYYLELVPLECPPTGYFEFSVSFYINGNPVSFM
ncbi:MAG: hypothetical protein JSW58_07720 [Candidatus Latescibacterota bacterium]|nr:MAG: hypothetical protein JSW58_07720 [Candidatus Latescibacterota bacterium]